MLSVRSSAAAIVAHLVLVAFFDEQQGAGHEPMPAAVHPREAAALHHEEPLVRAAVAVVRVALGISRRDDHLRRLGARVAESDPEAAAESKRLLLHAASSG